MTRADLTGQQFGLLTVKEYIGNSKWRCVCACGNETEVFATNLKRLHTTSCGCKKGTGILNRKFGDLLVKSQIENTNQYICVCCKCGETAVRTYKSLTQKSSRNAKCDKCAEVLRLAALHEKVFVAGTQPSRIQLDKKPSKANKSGVVGVNWNKRCNRWQAGIRFKGKRYNLGDYIDIKDAIAARKEAEQRIFGDFLAWYEEYKKAEE